MYDIIVNNIIFRNISPIKSYIIYILIVFQLCYLLKEHTESPILSHASQSIHPIDENCASEEELNNDTFSLEEKSKDSIEINTLSSLLRAVSLKKTKKIVKK